MTPKSLDATFDETAWREAVRRLSAPEPILPSEALRRHAEAAEASVAPGDVRAAWRRALVASAMRRRATGGRLSALLLDAALCDLDDLVRCVDLQLDDPPAPQTPLAFDLDDALHLVFTRAPVASLTGLARRLAAVTGPMRNDLNDPAQTRLAARLAEGRDPGGCAAALREIGWHGDLAGALGRAWPVLSDALCEELAARLWDAVAASALPAVHHVQYYCEVATWTRDPARLDAAEAAVRALPAADLAPSPDFAHPYEDLAAAFAAFDRWDDALALLCDLGPRDRWAALLRLIPQATAPALRDALWEDALGLSEDHELAPLLKRAPEAWPGVIARIAAIDDIDARLEASCAVAPHLPRAPAMALCAHVVEDVWRQPLDLARATEVERWSAALSALTAAACEELATPARRGALCDALLASPAVDLWREVLPYVPDDRLEAVVATLSARLARATHYLDRDEAMASLLTLLPRLDPAGREALLAFARPHAPRVSWDPLGDDGLRAWGELDARHIVAERLRIHQREFLDAHALSRWRRLRADASTNPCEADPRALCDALDRPDDDGAALCALARTWALGGRDAVDAVVADAVALLDDARAL